MQLIESNDNRYLYMGNGNVRPSQGEMISLWQYREFHRAYDNAPALIRGDFLFTYRTLFVEKQYLFSTNFKLDVACSAAILFLVT